MKGLMSPEAGLPCRKSFGSKGLRRFLLSIVAAQAIPLGRTSICWFDCFLANLTSEIVDLIIDTANSSLDISTNAVLIDARRTTVEFSIIRFDIVEQRIATGKSYVGDGSDHECES